MNSGTIVDSGLAPGMRFDLVEQFARRQVLSLLGRLERGRLLLQEGEGDVLVFGQSADDAEVTANVCIEDASAYTRLLRNGSIGVAEAYMSGHWHSPDLLAVVRLFAMNMTLLDAMERQNPLLAAAARRVGHLLRRNSLRGSKKNIVAHYDLSNEFFETFLDPSMMYSSAIFPREQASLEVASEHKIRHICEKLKLCADDHLLEIGTGWGALAIYAAQHYGCRVTTTTLSDAQYDYARKRIHAAGLEGQIELLKRDYRELSGRYDKLVSVEMIEAVGHQYYTSYFECCSRLLKEDGLMLIQAITMPDQRYRQALKSVDFIQTYIFPGGCLPSVSVMAEHVADDTDMQIVGLEDITAHYARTLSEWRQRFLRQGERVRELGFDDVFCRMWEFYLVYCEGGFRERVIGTSQIVMAKPGYRDAAVA